MEVIKVRPSPGILLRENSRPEGSFRVTFILKQCHLGCDEGLNQCRHLEFNFQTYYIKLILRP